MKCFLRGYGFSPAIYLGPNGSFHGALFHNKLGINNRNMELPLQSIGIRKEIISGKSAAHIFNIEICFGDQPKLSYDIKYCLQYSQDTNWQSGIYKTGIFPYQSKITEKEMFY